MRQRPRMRTALRHRVIIPTAILITMALSFIIFINLSNSHLTYAAASGDYRSAASGNWNSISTWEKFDGTNWNAATATPTSADGTITISNGTTVTVTGNVTVDQVSVQPNGQLLLNSGVTLTLANGSGTDLDINGIFTNAGTITINASANIVFEPNGTYQHNFSTSAGTIPAATWSTNSTCAVIGYTSNTSAPGGLQSFYNFVWNCPAQTATINLAGGLTTFRRHPLKISQSPSCQ